MDTEGISALVAAVSLAVSIVLGLVYLRDRRHAKYAIETEYCDQLLSWHGQVVESLLSLRAFSAQNTAPEMRLHLIKLSSLIEQGRFYFPNIKSDQHGLSKPPAYRGYRNIALDFLVASHKLYSKPRTDSTDRHGEFLQRMFTSVVFDAYLSVTADANNIYWRPNDKSLQACPIAGCSPEVRRDIGPVDHAPKLAFFSDGEHVYWPNQDQSLIVKTAIATGEVSTSIKTGAVTNTYVGTSTASVNVALWATDDDYIYFTDRDRAVIARVGK